MDPSAFLLLLFTTLIKTVAIAGVTFWLTLVTLSVFPTLGKYLVKLFGFDK